MNVTSLLGLPDSWEDKLLEHGDRATLQSGQFICMEGSTCHAMSILMAGAVRVYKSGETGREITLYRLQAGDSCILTASCILNNQLFPAFAVAESDIEALLIPRNVFKLWVNQHEEWRQYVFDLVYQRLQDVITLVEEVTFGRLDSRLAAHLLSRKAGIEGDTITTTHEAIAFDLGSSREVISRLLKEFEHQGFLELGRGTVHLLDIPALSSLSNAN